MEEDTIVGLPRPGRAVEGDPLLPVLREGARYRRWVRLRRRATQAARCKLTRYLKPRDGLMR
jgi:hypothetical protein